MVWKVIGVIVVFMMIVLSVSLVLDNLPMEPVELKMNHVEPESSEIIEYGSVPMFAGNMRFNHNLISYFIDEDCDASRSGDMIGAFNIFSEKVKLVSFYAGDENSDIKIGCSNDFIELSSGDDPGVDLFAAGEGGPSKILNTSWFKVIEEGTVLLYNVEDCDYPIVALHELGHVFGFDHSDDPDNIMYNVSSCKQRMNEDMVEVMTKLYSVEALSDARIESVNGFIHDRYLDFNISVFNEGLIDIENISLTVLADDEKVEVFDLGNVEIGYGRTLMIVNLMMPRGVEKVVFFVDADDNIRELDEGNNFVEMVA